MVAITRLHDGQDPGERVFPSKTFELPCTLNKVRFAYSGDRVLCARIDHDCSVIDPETSSIVLSLSGHTDSVQSCAPSAQSKDVICTASSDTTVRVWDSRVGSDAVCVLEGHKRP
eukprot:Hpha_TRINITY_DN1508_c0_g1::TRINITY_DN1508_c0_g1_i1::g.57188::m.57188